MFHRSYSSSSWLTMQSAKQLSSMRGPLVSAMGLLRSRCSCLGSGSSVDVPTLDEDKLHGSLGLASSTVVIDIQCYEQDDQASNSSISAASSTAATTPSAPSAAAIKQHRMSLSSLLAHKLTQLPAWASCLSYPQVKEAVVQTSIATQRQSDADAEESPKLSVQQQVLQDKVSLPEQQNTQVWE